MADQKIVVITGCSSGIGMDTAVLLAKDKGVKVIATMRNLQKKDALEKAAGECLNRSLIIKELDVSKEESITHFVKNTISEEGQIDVLVNNAGIGQCGPFESVSLGQMQAIFQTNFFGAARITQEVLPHMKRRRSGYIIFVSSRGGIKPMPFQDFYVASKFAIEGLVSNLAPVLRCFSIRITSVEPGPVKTLIVDNIERNNQGGVDFQEEPEGPEGETIALLKTLLEKYYPLFEDIEQTGTEVGEVIKKCIYDTNPPVRIQTSDAVTEMVKQVLVDHTGNQVTDELEAFLK